MATLRKYILICFGIFQLYCGVGKAQNVPAVPCPEIFQYMSFGDSYIGMVTLNNLPLETTVVGVKFSQREPISAGDNGRLSQKGDVSEIQSSLEKGQPITYRIDFPTPHVLPKLMEIKVNGKIVCSGGGYSDPSTTFNLQHSFEPSKKTPLTYKADNNIVESDNGHVLELTPTRTEIFQTVPSFPIDRSKFLENIRKQFGDQLGDQVQTMVYKIPSSRTQQNIFTPQQQQQITLKQPLQIPITPQQPGITDPGPGPAPAVRKPTSWSDIGCGREGLTPFVVDGNDFQRGKFPWLVATYVRVAADLKFRCGGSLISSRTVITAAHCFPPSSFAADQIFVVLGRHNLFISEDGSQQRDVASVSVNPSYNTSRISDADIALLHMSSPVSFSQYIRPICLWSESTDQSLIVDTEAFVAGWGGDNNGNRVSPSAKMVIQKIVSESVCLRSSDLFSAITSSRSICAGSRDGSGPCMGDSGGGLMLYISGVWILRGVLSVGGTVNNKCDLNQYIVYCDVAPHMTWIRQNMLT